MCTVNIRGHEANFCEAEADAMREALTSLLISMISATQLDIYNLRVLLRRARSPRIPWVLACAMIFGNLRDVASRPRLSVDFSQNQHSGASLKSLGSDSTVLPMFRVSVSVQSKNLVYHAIKNSVAVLQYSSP